MLLCAAYSSCLYTVMGFSDDSDAIRNCCKATDTLTEDSHKRTPKNRVVPHFWTLLLFFFSRSEMIVVCSLLQNANASMTERIEGI